MPPILEVSGLSYSYHTMSGETKALSDISFQVETGEFIAIVGPSGCGKSTLAKHFNAILLPESGTVLVEGMDTKDEDKIYDIRQTVGMVFQSPDNQIVATVVEEDVAFALENLGVPPEEMRRRVDEAMKMAGIYKHREKAPHKLSGGQKQRISIARALLKDAPILILDDSVSAVDTRTEKIILDNLKSSRANKTTLLIAHRISTVERLDKIIFLDDGKIEAVGPHDELYTSCPKYRRMVDLQRLEDEAGGDDNA